ncbi:O-antigen polymerase [Vibrio cholerae]|uniref:O-antigen polymerase n=2 Tax=Vibrio cholerae TaxID=666 RepID=UPI0022AF5A90|nr:O-antigen polymerase [Vibrio cholerae]
MKLISPIIVYFFAWGLVLLLYSLGLTKNLFPFSWAGIAMIIANFFSMAIIYLMVNYKSKSWNKYNINDYTPLVLGYAKVLFVVWLLGTIIEIYHGQGFPLMWVMTGTGKLYTEFGIPSFHGVMNACFLQLVTALTYLGVLSRKKKYLWFILILLTWPVLMLGRGILLSAIVQIVVITLFFVRIKPKHLFLLLLLGITFIICFGVLGDMRQNSNPFAYLVYDEYKDFFDSIPTGFLWVYVYLTAGVSNLFYNLPALEATYSFDYSFSNMLPTIVRDFFNISGRNDLFIFVDHNLNTSTIYAGFTSDFWILGGFVMVMFIQFLSCIAYRIANRGRPWGVFSYSVFFQILLFSIFYDMFFLLPTLFQISMTVILFVFSHFGSKYEAINTK